MRDLWQDGAVNVCTVYGIRNQAKTDCVAAEDFANRMPSTSEKTDTQRLTTSRPYLLCSAINIHVAIPAAVVVSAMANYIIY